jgi:hypothetical protein
MAPPEPAAVEAVVVIGRDGRGGGISLDAPLHLEPLKFCLCLGRRLFPLLVGQPGGLQERASNTGQVLVLMKGLRGGFNIVAGGDDLGTHFRRDQGQRSEEVLDD